MGEQLFGLIRQVGIFIVCAQTIAHFRPRGSYEKYLKLLVSIMIMVQIVLPVLNMLGSGEKIDPAAVMKRYESILSGEGEMINITTVTAEEMVEEMTLREINSRLNNLEEWQEAGNTETVQTDTGNEESEIELVVIEKVEVD